MDPILIIKLGALGDVMRTTGFLKGLSQKHGAPIYWISMPNALPVLSRIPLITRALTMEEWPSIAALRFSMVISLDDEQEACHIATSANSERIIGAYLKADGTRAYSADAAPWFDMGLLGGPDRDDLKKANQKTYQEILSAILSIDADATPLFPLGEEERTFQQTFREQQGIKAGEKLVGINTGAGGRWQYKKLGEVQTAALIDAIQERMGMRCVLLGGPEEAARNATILSYCKSAPIDAGTDNDLMRFAAIIDLCTVLVSSDSLALHIATALRKQIVAFFGPTSSAEIDLFGRGVKVMPDMSCLVCYKRTCSFNPACMQLISTDRLLVALKGVLA